MSEITFKTDAEEQYECPYCKVAHGLDACYKITIYESWTFPDGVRVNADARCPETGKVYQTGFLATEITIIRPDAKSKGQSDERNLYAKSRHLVDEPSKPSDS